MSDVNCRIGLVSFSLNNSDIYLILGELFDYSILNDIKSLYKIHKNTKYFCYFNINSNKNLDIKPDNLEEIKKFQKKYNFTGKIILHGLSKYTRVKFNPPLLYDINCMVPLFDEKIIYQKYIIKEDKNLSSFRFVIFIAIKDIVIRGNIIENFFTSFNDNKKTYFYIMGKKSTCILTKRYLHNLGVPYNLISISDYVKIPECIYEGIEMSKVMYPVEKLEYVIVVYNKFMNNILKYIKLLRNKNIINTKIELICNI